MWEYAVIDVCYSESDGSKSYTFNGMEMDVADTEIEMLNRMGRGRWELVNAALHASGLAYVYYFKRQIKEGW